MKRHTDVQPIDETWRDYRLAVIIHWWSQRRGYESWKDSDRFRALQAARPDIAWELNADGEQVLGHLEDLTVEGYDDLRRHASALSDVLEPLLVHENSWVQLHYEPRNLPPRPQGFLFSLRPEPGLVAGNQQGPEHP